ncbi:MAG: hypothetical protein QM783_11925 [Phycisphaerales bacterium]
MKKFTRALLISLCVGSPLALAQQPADKPAATAPAVKAADPIKLLDAGAEPRHTLRYKATKGDTYGFEMKMKMSMAMKMGGNAMPSTAMPTMVMGGDVKVIDITPDGNTKLSFTYGQGRLEDTEGVMPQVVSAMEPVMSQLNGMSGEFVFTPRGEYVSGEFKIPEGMDPMAKQTIQGMSKSMEQYTVPLPAEPVGKGAKWECARTQENNGIKMNATYTQQVIDLSDKDASLKTQIKGEAKDQQVQGMTIDSMILTGDGEQRIGFSRIIPDAKVNSGVAMTMDSPQGKMEMNMSVKMDMKSTEAGKATAPAKEKPKATEPDKTKPAPKF